MEDQEALGEVYKALKGGCFGQKPDRKRATDCFSVALVVLPVQHILNRFKHELKQNGAESAERVLMSGSDGVQAVSF